MDREITLLVGFDATYYFVEAFWKDEFQSDDVALLLGSMQRDVQKNTPPLDAGQWSDWLDAVLSVRPDLDDVKTSRQQIQKSWKKFVRFMDRNSNEPLSDAQRANLESLRAEASKHTWHRVGDQPIGVMDAYKAMRVFITAFIKRDGRKSSGLGLVVGDDVQQKNLSDAYWKLWIHAVDKASYGTSRE